MKSSCLAKVVFSDAKHNFLLHYLAAFGVLITAPIIFGLSELSERMSAQPMEIISAIIGITVLTPIFMPEQNLNIYDLVRSKKTSHTLVCFFRIICSLTVTALLSGGLALFMRYNSSDVGMKLYVSALSGAFAVGSLGLLVSSLSNNVIIGYMVSAMYFMGSMFLRNKLGVFDLFTISDGGDTVNIFLYFIFIIFTIIALIFRKRIFK